ncbi:MAG TPA: aldehyde dehydrogenase family protein [Gammaproteobacteria bacterium]|jgi:aldehyde dehydrogenase (NAD+)|nr:aldehyde dehydrogenase family protein [Gammaproteobacteria bacterium]
MKDIFKLLGLTEKNSGTTAPHHGWSDSTKGEEIISYNPTTGDPIASVVCGGKDELESVIKTAENAFLSWRDVPAPKRGEVVRAIGDILREHKSALGYLVSLEMGKSQQEGEGEVQEMIDMADLAVGQSRMLYGCTMQSERPAHRMYEQWLPLGVVTVITAFNFPVAVWAWNAFLAVICGNTVIWKPSLKVPLCAIAVMHLCHRVLKQYQYEDIFSLFIPKENDLVTQLVADDRIALVSFTGSTAVGLALNKIVAGRLGRILLELSGNNAIIVDETADLSLAIPAIVFGAIGTAGQRCTTTRRLIVHESLYQKVIDALVSLYQKITIGDPLQPENMVGPLVDQQAVDHFQRVIIDIQKQGGKILYGGHVLPGKGFFVEPTIVAAQNECEIVQRETFAPILYVMSYHTFDEAIAMQNRSAFGLSSSLFTQRLTHAEMFLSARGSDCGIANINIGTSGAEIGGAFGGEKGTGGGREAGSDVWKHYMRRQTNTINWGGQLALAQGILFDI